ncbi:MAG: 5-(carboxyamino)imidazole ribonucleotide synthase [Bacteroidia bacterium]|nr:5-(carboxyamino)imidazole ribonucleotide synthase [Bacteroidia bacterium]
MTEHFYDKLRLGILGGGQLGRMLLQKAADYNITVNVLDPDPEAPCKSLCTNLVEGSFDHFETVYNFGKSVDLLTIEIEHVNTEALEMLEKEGVLVYPQSRVIALVQDKGAQKIFFRTHSIPTAEFHIIESSEQFSDFESLFPCIQKLRRGGYDGRGVKKLDSLADVAHALPGPCLIEKLVDFKTEISVIVARNSSGEIVAYPPVEMEFNSDANLVEFLYSPSSLSKVEIKEATQIAIHVAKSLEIVGILAVEMFLTHDGKILVNEIAPRPHNSGHQSIEGNICSQYDQHLRAIFGIPFGSTKIIKPAVMINLLGEPNHSGLARFEGLEEAMAEEGVYVHLYGKKYTRPFRKMGHITVLADSIAEAKSAAVKIKKTVRVVSSD